MTKSLKQLLACIPVAAVVMAAAALPAAAINVGAGVGIGVGGAVDVNAASVPVRVDAGAMSQINATAGQQAQVQATGGRDASAHLRALIAQNGSANGSVTAIQGNAVTVRLSDGTSATFDVAAALASSLKVGDAVTIMQRDKAFVLARTSDMNREIRENGSITAISGTAVTIAFANGTTQTLNVSQALATELRVGEHVVLTAKNGHAALGVANGLVRSSGSMAGKITAISGNTLAVQLADGSMVNLAVSAAAAARFHAGEAVRIARRGAGLVVTAAQGAARVVTPVMGRITAMSGNLVSVRLSNGTIASFRVSSSNAAQLALNERVRVVTRGGVTTIARAKAGSRSR